ncbi:transcription antitermination factor NusB [Taibaiella sp. KBW10]|uniref:transcription antitermination factor NusB n=1 Tax=Taibaiella sp. KBW10 TaxID=2153357 RepID=UPI0013152A25|nr:transcription antitermination factor NusB [Taibaiella sp. KBW10]
MQALYALDTLGALEFKDNDAQRKKGLQVLTQKFMNAAELFNISVLYLARIAQFAETDARLRSSKYLPSAADMNVNTKISGNIYLWHLLENDTFNVRVSEDKLDDKIETDRVKKMYQHLCTEDTYLSYIEKEERTAAEDKAMLYFIWKNEMIKNEDFLEYMTDTFDGWEDDKDMVMMLMENFFKNPKTINFLQFISLEKNEYARSLLTSVLEKETVLMEYIEPKLKNWDADRVASIDLILLKMGISEFLFFPTIPTKVTINEYIEIAKNYSTPQSGQFINGVLDNLLKELTQENKIRKIERSKN